ncbi:MAG: hypothetical protein QF645_07680 [Planctomycetota bacterium]|nr:hypothetical protein [Planctomycetota bacterium]
MQGFAGTSMSFFLFFVGGIVSSSGVVIHASERYSNAFEAAEIRVEMAKEELMQVSKPGSPGDSLKKQVDVFSGKSVLVAHNVRANEVGVGAWEGQVKPRFIFRLFQNAWQEKGTTSLGGVLQWAKDNPGKTLDLLEDK